MALVSTTRVDVRHILLSAVGASVLNVETLVTDALKTLSTLKKNDRRYRSPYYVEGAIRKLTEQGLFCVETENTVQHIHLTDAGSRELEKYTTESQILKPQKWDGKWRLVIFDIKETNKGKRDRIRRNLVRFGFEKLQDSIWVYPYECEDLITLLKADCQIGKEVLYLVSEKIQDDGWIRRKFKLSIIQRKNVFEK